MRPVCYLAIALQIGLAACDPQKDVAALETPHGTAEEELRIGAVDDPDLAFSSVVALEVGHDGDIYSLHPEERMLRHWSASGELIGTIGREGDGPGEFRMPRTLGWSGDSLWVVDSSLTRISFFDAAGRYVGALSPTVDLGSVDLNEQGVYPARPVGMLGDGSIYGETSPAAPAAHGVPIRLHHVRMGPDGATLDTIFGVAYGRELNLTLTFDAGMRYGSPQPFTDRPLITLARDGRSLLVLERRADDADGGNAFHLLRLGLSGDTIDSRAYPYRPVAIPRDTIERELQQRVERVNEVTQGMGISLSQIQTMVRDAMYIPDAYPPVGHLVAGRDGTVWLSRQPQGSTGTEWLVLDAQGEPIGRVELPRALTLMAAERSRVWGIERDEYDVDYIVRYRVRFATGG